MSNVPKSQRKKQPFEARQHFSKLSGEVADLLMNSFGYSDYQYEKLIERFGNNLKIDEDRRKDAVERMEFKRKNFDEWFIQHERDTVLTILRQAVSEFTIGNSIFPTGEALMEEYKERRMHMDKSIAYCYDLIAEIQFAIETLPVDLNKFNHFNELITKQIELIKGVRQSDNRFLKPEQPNTNKKKKKKKENNNGDNSDTQVKSADIDSDK